MLPLALLLPLLAAAPGPWERTCGKEGVVVEKRDGEGAIRELRAEAVIGAPPEACLKAVRTPEFFRRAMSFVDAAELIGRDGPDVVYFYTRVAPPFVAARESTLQVVVEPIEGIPGAWRQRWTLAHERGPRPREGSILVPLNDGAWEFMPLEGGRRTLARYRLRTDPGGELPGWLVERGNVAAVLAAFRELRRASGAPAVEEAGVVEGGG